MSKTNKELQNDERLEKLQGSLQDDGMQEGIVNIHSGKPGYDPENGKYRILGAVSPNPVSVRKNAGTNIAKACGYHIEEIETGRTFKTTIKEGYKIASEFGMRNAYITHRDRKKKDKEGNVIKNWASIYLQPFPAIQESFTQDARLVNVYALDENGKIEYPLELKLTEEECTVDFWMLIKELYEKKKGKRGGGLNKKKITEEKHKEQVMKLKAEISGMDVRNPFDYE